MQKNTVFHHVAVVVGAVVVVTMTRNFNHAVTGFSFHQKQQPTFSFSSTCSSSLSTTSSLYSTALSSSSSSSSPFLLSNDVYEAIERGNIAVIPNFLTEHDIHLLRTDAQTLWDGGYFSTDALASYGQSGKFDIRKDRAVLKLNQWKNQQLGNYELRGNDGLGNKMAQLRKDLAYHLDRPMLDRGLSTTKYGEGSTEISYTRFGPGAFLKRHVDEHHEELKGVAGWSQPTRRSISWLIYLNSPDWNSRLDGGQLRCFQRRQPQQLHLGAQPNGDLQIGWLRSTKDDPIERPVFLDGRKEEAGMCAMYIRRSETDNDNSGQSSHNNYYITDKFQSHPTLYLGGIAGETLVKRFISQHTTNNGLANRFYFIETPKTLLRDLQMRDYDGSGEPPLSDDETIVDVDPLGGTLVLFDSVTLPHEVLATRNNKTRWATSGWFHEDQQPPLLVV